METPELKSFPTIRAQMGDWFYYLTTFPFYEVAHRIRPATEFFHPNNMNEWIQREVIPRRRNEIAEYLLTTKERFFNGIVVGIYLGEPNWYGIEVDENNIFGAPGLDRRFENALGVLELTGDERLYAIDGQHRVAGIKEALDQLEHDEERVDEYRQLANEDLGIIMVAADIDAGQLQRIRRMFSTLNKTARPVSKAELVALDEDDASAIITRRLATEFKELNKVTPVTGQRPDWGLVHLGKSTQISPSNHHSITTIVTLYDIVGSALSPEVATLRAQHGVNRAGETQLQELYEKAEGIWNLLKENSPEMADVLGSEPGNLLASKYRRDDGGHVLFRPIGQQAFSDALGVLRSRQIPTETAIRYLCSVPMQLAQLPWERVMWDPTTNKMVNSNRALAGALFLHMVGQTPKSKTYDLEERYQALYGEIEKAPFDQLPVNPIP